MMAGVFSKPFGHRAPHHPGAQRDPSTACDLHLLNKPRRGRVDAAGLVLLGRGSGASALVLDCHLLLSRTLPLAWRSGFAWASALTL